MLAVFASGICTAQTDDKPFRIEAAIGTLTNWQKLSIYDNGFSNMRCPASDIFISYELLKDTLALGLKNIGYSLEYPETDETIYISFVAANFRYIRPLQFTDDIKIKLYFEWALGCTFLRDWFSYNDISYKTTRRGFGMDYAIGFNIPIFYNFSIGLKCGYFLSFPSKVDVAAEVPAENFKSGEQIITATRIMATLSVGF
ncbi:MAG: hypothetical protein IKX51_07710 [Bacteroidales bacterium]|nr:hypothetical protein [Bacteroidales bacterium]